MSRDLFQYFPIVIAALYFLVALVLIFAGATGVRRGRGSAPKSISAAALAVGLTMVLVLGLSIVLNARIFTSLPLVFLLLGAFGFVVWVSALADCAINEPSPGNDKLVWVIIIVFTNIVGAVLYLVARRPRRIAEAGK